MSQKTMLVKAAALPDPALAGKNRVAKEGTTNRWITEDEPVSVPVTAYYLRKIHSGELERCEVLQPGSVESDGR